jgi:hypothetical protein
MVEIRIFAWVAWSQTRCGNYAVLRVDVIPGGPGSDSTMTVGAIHDLGRSSTP